MFINLHKVICIFSLFLYGICTLYRPVIFSSCVTSSTKTIKLRTEVLPLEAWLVSVMTSFLAMGIFLFTSTAVPSPQRVGDPSSDGIAIRLRFPPQEYTPLSLSSTFSALLCLLISFSFRLLICLVLCLVCGVNQ